MQKIIQFRFFFIILALFTATWLLSNIAAVKLVSIFGINLTGGFIIFPLTMMLSNIIVEVYGYKNSRQAIWSGFILNLSFIFFINLVYIIPASSYWKLQTEFHNILVPSTRIIIASLISFLISDFSSSYLMAKMKIKSRGQSLLKRILISYSLSISIDITCFMTLAFAGTMPTSVFLKLMAAAYIKKILCQAILLPIIWYLIDELKKREGIEIYDYDTRFNPFLMDNIYELTSYKEIKSVTKSNAVEKAVLHFTDK
ncbi:MAG: queuosine precursor transporter [Gammaproteobacteria bacterium]